MIKNKYIMHCGCELSSSDLIVYDTLLSCPIHKKRIKKIEKLCKRCAKLFVVTQSSSKKIYCDDCVKILDQARTVHNYHKLKVFVDPILLRKGLNQILTDISINVSLGYTAIQIDTVRETQHENKKIFIDLDKKIAILQKKEEKQCQQEIAEAA